MLISSTHLLNNVYKFKLEKHRCHKLRIKFLKNLKIYFFILLEIYHKKDHSKEKGDSLSLEGKGDSLSLEGKGDSLSLKGKMGLLSTTSSTHPC